MDEHKSRYELSLEQEEKPQSKRCPKCGKTKALGEFHVANGRKIGVQSRCKECRSRAKYKNREDIFWKSYHAKTVRAGDCLEWTGAYTSLGYPVCEWNYKEIHIIRLVYKLSIGPITSDDVILLSCNNKRCVRHSHLLKATKEDRRIKASNMQATGSRHGSKTRPDSILRGASHPMSKLTELDVRAIRTLYDGGGILQREIAKMFCITEEQAHRIINRKSWKHVE